MSLIDGLVNGGALPSLERLAEFTEARHNVLAHNVANVDTPFFQATDLDPRQFQDALADAQRRRRDQTNPMRGELAMRSTRQIEYRGGRMAGVQPGATGDNILRHDQNNTDLDRLMQNVAENTMTHHAAMNLLQNQFQMLSMAIRERL